MNAPVPTKLTDHQRAVLGLEPAPKTPRTHRRITLPLAATLIVGSVFWAASCGAGIAMGTPEPSAPVTISEPGPTAKIEVPGPTVKVAPKSCVDALDAADSGLKIAGDVGLLAGKTVEIMIEGMEAAFYHDADGMDAVTKKIEKMTAKVDAKNLQLEHVLKDYADDRDACKAAAK